jgi:Flp pilus assembly CpaF family ATPase
MRALEQQKIKRQTDNFLSDISDLAGYLRDPAVTDIATSHCGEIIVKKFGEGKTFTGLRLNASRIKSIIYSAAMLLDKTVDPVAGIPKLEAVLPPPYNARITGLLPPGWNTPRSACGSRPK